MCVPDRFREARNARLVAAYEERLASAQLGRRLLGLSSATKVASNAKQMRRQLQQNTAQASESRYFRRQKVVIGLSVCCLTTNTRLLYHILLL